jgi:predicted HTH domain antitoxin
MATVGFEVGDGALLAVAKTPEEFACAARLAAAMYWYGRREVSLEVAAEIAGLDVRGFLSALSSRQQDIFVVDVEDVRAELDSLPERGERNVSGG